MAETKPCGSLRQIFDVNGEVHIKEISQIIWGSGNSVAAEWVGMAAVCSRSGLGNAVMMKVPG